MQSTRTYLGHVVGFIFVCLVSANTSAAMDRRVQDSFQIYQNYKVKPGSEIALTNLPLSRDQHTGLICYAAAAAAALDYYRCRTEGLDCKALTDDERVSVLQMAWLGSNTYPPGLDDLIQANNAAPVVGEDGIPIFADKKDEIYKIVSNPEYFPDLTARSGQAGSASLSVLNTLSVMGRPAKETCAPMSRLFETESQTEFTSQEAYIAQSVDNQTKDFARISAIQHCYAIRQTDALNNCLLALSGLTSDRISEKKLLALAQTESINTFLARLLYPKICLLDSTSTLRISDAAAISQDDDKFSDYPKAISQIKSVLKKQDIITVDGYCLAPLDVSREEDCVAPHSFLITGYRQVCAQTSDCADELRILNSWGKAWQESADGGWVGAQSLLDRTFYKAGVFHWIADRY